MNPKQPRKERKKVPEPRFVLRYRYQLQPAAKLRQVIRDTLRLEFFGETPVGEAFERLVTLVAALVMTPGVVGACVTLAGGCWITVIANNGASVQMILPNFMRARGMAVHQMVFFGSMVVGSLFWGKVATLLGTQAALLLSAASLVPFTVLAATIRLPGSTLPRA